MQHKNVEISLAFSLLVLASLACQAIDVPILTSPTPVSAALPDPQTLLKPRIVLQRLGVSFLGQDNHRIIGSGCPGTDRKGTIVDYHLIVSGVNEDLKVERIVVTGDNSTLTWEFPCSDDWALSAKDLGSGNWEIFIAPSLPSRVYTVIIFYEDNSFALGMDIAP